MYTLGLNAAFHDSAACLMRDGVVIAAAEEERFTGIKHGKRPVPFTAWELPYHAIDYCLAEEGITIDAIEHVAYSLAPELLPEYSTVPMLLPMEPSAATGANGAAPWSELLVAYAVNAPRQLAGGAPHHLDKRLRSHRTTPSWQWHFVPHHLAHQASAFLAAPFDAMAVLTLDGRGERASTQYGRYRDGRYEVLGEVALPHSLGLMYEAVTRHLGFLHSSDEYKVMALASFGTPRFVEAFAHDVHFTSDGQFVTNPVDLSRFCPQRQRGGPMEAVHADLAYAMQHCLELTVLHMARWLRGVSGCEHLAMAGGVALNCVMNGRLRRALVFDDIWIQPAAGDAGTALGAALWIDRAQANGTPRERYRMEHAYLGPGYDEASIKHALDTAGASYRRPDTMVNDVAHLLDNQHVVGWFQGRMEFGPRALGNRSILASPHDPTMQAKLNALKDREDFRPVAPAVRAEATSAWFGDARRSPFMLFVDRATARARKEIPSALHVDHTARVQTVDAADNPLFHQLLTAFERQSGIPVLINTSFNSLGRPIVCSPQDALACYFTSPLDALAIGPFLLQKRAA
jgi:carbamoyltransferase